MEQKSSGKQRIEYIDLLRAFGIFVMIMGHVAFGGHFDKWIHIFHMPMFFIVSGYFYRLQPFCRMIGRRAKTLLLPYYVLGILQLIIYFILRGGIDIHAFYIFFLENTAGIPIAGALWFLTAMFFTEVLFWCVQSVNCSEVVRTLISAVVSVAGMTCAVYMPFRLPLAFDVGMVGVGLYQIGKLIKERFPKVLEISIGPSIIGIIIFSVLGMLNGYVNLRLGKYSMWPLFWINTVGLTLSFWNFFRHVHRLFEEKGYFRKTMAWIRSIGRDSIVFVCLNQLAILFAGIGVRIIVPSTQGIIYSLIRQIGILVVAMIELFFIQKLIMKTKLKVLLGKG